ALARFARSAERLTCAISGRDMEAAGTRARLEMDPARAVWSGAIKRGIRREPHAPATFIIIHIYAQPTPPATAAGPSSPGAHGAAAYSPAKYGILTELLPARLLVIANGWIEGTTVGSIILGVLLGGVLISGPVSSWLLAIDIPKIDTGIQTPPQAAIAVIMGCYAIAAVFNWYIPDTGVERRVASKNPLYLIREFAHCNA